VRISRKEDLCKKQEVIVSQQRKSIAWIEPNRLHGHGASSSATAIKRRDVRSRRRHRCDTITTRPSHMYHVCDNRTTVVQRTLGCKLLETHRWTVDEDIGVAVGLLYHIVSCSCTRLLN